MITKVCKDCYPTADDRAMARLTGGAMVNGKLVRVRDAVYQGPRCYTHHHQNKRNTKTTRHAKRVADTYNLPDGMYEKLLEYQGGRCALCRWANGTTRKLSVDHDHKCCDGPKSCGDCVRGLLCRPCNTLLGHARDAMSFFQRCMFYLQHPPYHRMRSGIPRLGVDKEGPDHADTD